ncbi:SPOSA6832_00564 [Sporobolomyces salmonicolor]|uniref:SPOSA6832_00564-mRNA-1:cds n=1 Tax=Sporidiobolus salmonicolor TaxID=5005 RepID=A0A0D6EH11_SPOSA|nr:SPOSA6832_00564 [Sporobolomyces salmonicolor]
MSSETVQAEAAAQSIISAINAPSLAQMELTNPHGAGQELEDIDRNLYRSKELWKVRPCLVFPLLADPSTFKLTELIHAMQPGEGRGVFGGQIIAQAAWAATQSVRRDEPETKKGLHSLHCYFLNFGNADIPVLYTVQRLRDGRSYSTRTVLATQAGTPIFTLTCSFCVPEPKQPVRALPLPRWPLKWTRTEEEERERKERGEKIPEPEECEPTEEVLRKALDQAKSLPEKLRTFVERNAEERRQSSIELRNTDKSVAIHFASLRSGNCGTELATPTKDVGHIFSYERSASQQLQLMLNPLPNRQLYWFRSRAPVVKDPDFQKCVLAYASDLNFIGTAARATGLGSSTRPRLGMLASLDHSMYFYDDTVDAHDWLLYYMNSPVTSNGRGLVQGRIYKRDGTLAVVCSTDAVYHALNREEQTQEGVVRAAL